MEAWCGVKTATFHSAVLCMDLSNVAGTEWEEISATSFQNLEILQSLDKAGCHHTDGHH